jgi:hypothetical protein
MSMPSARLAPLAALLLAAAAAAPAAAEPLAYAIDPANTHVYWEVPKWRTSQYTWVWAGSIA